MMANHYAIFGGGAHGLMVIVIGNGHGDTSSNPGRDIAFHIAQIPLGKVWIQLFSLQLWVNSKADWFFSLAEATSLGEGKLNSNLLTFA